MGNITGVFEAVPIDYFFLGGIAFIVALDALRGGIGRAVALAIALPLALLFTAFLEKAAFLGALVTAPLAAALAFGALVILLYILIRRSGLDFLDGGAGQPVQAALAGAAVAVIAAVVWLEADSLHSLWQFGPHVHAVFAEQFRLFWLLGAYAALAFARG